MQKWLQNILRALFGINSIIWVHIVIAADNTSIANFSGTLTQSTCTVQSGNSITIQLDKVSINQLITKTEGLGRKAVDLVLTGCPERVQLEFTGPSDPKVSKYLESNNIGVSNAARNIAVRPFIRASHVSGGEDNWIEMPRYTRWLNNSSQDKLVKFQVGGDLMPTSDSPIAGQIVTRMFMTFSYP